MANWIRVKLNDTKVCNGIFCKKVVLIFHFHLHFLNYNEGTGWNGSNSNIINYLIIIMQFTVTWFHEHLSISKRAYLTDGHPSSLEFQIILIM